MGILNLLKELQPITSSNVHIEMFRGKRCGVDASCWLHRAAYSCAWDLISGKKPKKWLGCTLKYIKLLQHNNITPIIVFDGDKLPMKANEEYRRNASREDNKQKAIKYYKDGDNQNGYKYATRAIRITKDMVTGFMNQCIANNIQFICAPYEADSQLGYMYKNGDIDFVISEDSDLLLFGVKKVFYKFDNGRGDLVDMDEIKKYKYSNGGNGNNKNKNKNKKKMDLCLFLRKYKDIKEFINVCVLSGCDYIKSIPGIGLKTAVKHCNENRRIDFLIHHLIQKIKMDKREKDYPPKDYKIQFKRAVLTFLHQTVYDINTKKLTHLNPLTQDVDDYLEELRKHLSRLPQQENNRNNTDNNKNPTVYDTTLNFLGKKQNEHTAILIAEGKLDARTLKKRNLKTNTNNNNNNLEDDNIERNRFFAPSKTQRNNNNNNVFQSESNQNNIRNERRRYRKKTTPKKENKYFGAVNNDSMNKENDAEFLNDLMTQFRYQNNKNSNHNDNDNDNEWFDNTEDTYTLDMDEKDDEDNNDQIIVPNSDEEEEEENYDNKPLKRQNRKRKRSEMEQLDNSSPLKNIRNINNISLPMKSKRKLNNGSMQFNNHHTMNHKTITPKSKFIQKVTPKNVQELMKKSVSSEDGLISDLFSSSKSRLRKKDRIQNKENIERSGNKNRNRMININKKNNNRKKKSLAMIGAKNKPIDISDTESDINTDNDVEIISIKRKPHPFLSYDDDNDNNKKIIRNRNNIGCNDEFYEVLDDDEEDENEDEDKDQIYSQLSQSQSEKQMTDVLNEFHIQSQQNDERKDEDTNNNDDDDDDDDDDDIEIIENVIESEITKKEITENKKITAKKFKPPRQINTNKKLPNKSKKKSNKNRKTAIKKKGKIKDKTQKKLTNYFFKKI